MRSTRSRQRLLADKQEGPARIEVEWTRQCRAWRPSSELLLLLFASDLELQPIHRAAMNIQRVDNVRFCPDRTVSSVVLAEHFACRSDQPSLASASPQDPSPTARTRSLAARTHSEAYGSQLLAFSLLGAQWALGHQSRRRRDRHRPRLRRAQSKATETINRQKLRRSERCSWRGQRAHRRATAQTSDRAFSSP